MNPSLLPTKQSLGSAHPIADTSATAPDRYTSGSEVCVVQADAPPVGCRVTAIPSLLAATQSEVDGQLTWVSPASASGTVTDVHDPAEVGLTEVSIYEPVITHKETDGHESSSLDPELSMLGMKLQAPTPPVGSDETATSPASPTTHSVTDGHDTESKAEKYPPGSFGRIPVQVDAPPAGAVVVRIDGAPTRSPPPTATQRLTLGHDTDPRNDCVEGPIDHA
jgi:hypothetical protein